MKTIITGCAGFIMSHLVEAYIEKHPTHQIIGIDKMSSVSRISNMESFIRNPNFKFIKTDINNIEEHRNEIGEVDIIINGAASSSVDDSIINNRQHVHDNYLGNYAMLEFARKSKNDIKYLYVSTDEVYGEALHDKGSQEFDSLMPKSPYASTKAGADRLSYSYWTTYGLPVIITRSSNNYGERQFEDKLIPKFIKSIKQNKPCQIYGTGENIRDWVYVKDNCQGILRALETPNPGEIYNIGSGEEKSVLDIVKELKKYYPNLEMMSLQDRLGHVKRHGINWEKIERIGWKPIVKFNDGFKQTFEWYDKFF